MNKNAHLGIAPQEVEWSSSSSSARNCLLREFQLKIKHKVTAKDVYDKVQWLLLQQHQQPSLTPLNRVGIHESSDFC